MNMLNIYIICLYIITDKIHVAVWHNMIQFLQYMATATHYRITFILYFLIYFNCS